MCKSYKYISRVPSPDSMLSEMDRTKTKTFKSNMYVMLVPRIYAFYIFCRVDEKLVKKCVSSQKNVNIYCVFF